MSLTWDGDSAEGLAPIALDYERKQFLFSSGGAAAPPPDGATIVDGSFRLFPIDLAKRRERSVFFLSGAAGSGKSYLSTEIAEMYRLAGRPVLIITDVRDPKFDRLDAEYLDIDELVGPDPAFDEAQARYRAAKTRMRHYLRIARDRLQVEDIVAMEARVEEEKPDRRLFSSQRLLLEGKAFDDFFRDALVIFDDYETNADVKRISFLRDDLLVKGRHLNTSLVICNHTLNDGHAFRLIKQEATDFVLYRSVEPSKATYFMEKTLGMEKSAVARTLLTLESNRWCCLSRWARAAISPSSVFTWDFERRGGGAGPGGSGGAGHPP